MNRTAKLNTIVERTAWAAGTALLVAYAGAEWHFARSHDAGLRRFAAAREQTRQLPPANDSLTDEIISQNVRITAEEHSKPAGIPDDIHGQNAGPGQDLGLKLDTMPSLRTAAPDMTSWSAGRITAYQVEEHSSTPEAVLRVAAIDLEVPVFAGVTTANLNRGAAWIDGTASLGGPGNIGLASHRDGYFRALRDIRVGDRIELQTLDRTKEYVVEGISVVDPTAVEVLAPSDDERLTLVTCYPFYMIGPAPKRFVVQARIASAREAS